MLVTDQTNSQNRFNELAQALKHESNSISGRLWVAYSGGIDSTVLLHAANEALRSDRLGAIHVNHGLSPNADRWEAHCSNIADSLGIRFESRSVLLRGNKEAAGRRARLRIFSELLSHDDVIVAGHHRDDEIESLAWQSDTGRAMVGIAKRLALGTGYLLRPMLDLSRADIAAIAEGKKLDWIEDESNMDLSLSRNRLRHLDLPKLREEFSNYDSVLFNRKLPSLKDIPQRPLEITVENTDRVVVRSWLHAYGITPKERVVVEIVRQMVARPDADMSIRVSPFAFVGRHAGKLHLIKNPRHFVPSSITVCGPKSIHFEYGVLRWAASNGGLPNNVKLSVRHRSGGEQITMDGKKTRLSEWFRLQRVSPWERSAWPLLFGEDELIAVPGLGVDDHVRVNNGWFPCWCRSDEDDSTEN